MSRKKFQVERGEGRGEISESMEGETEGKNEKCHLGKVTFSGVLKGSGPEIGLSSLLEFK